MSPQTRMRLFTIFAPITAPAYLLFLAFANLLGFAYYIVVEATLTPFLKRPISLTRRQMALLAVPVLLLAPAATLAQLLVWLVRLAGRGLCAAGRWQTGVRKTAPAFAFGLIWLLAAIWTTTACFNAAVAMSWFGDPLKGRADFVQHVTRPKSLGEMPPQMQERRREMLADVARLHEGVYPEWQRFQMRLSDDDWPVGRLPDEIVRRLADVPWYFTPAEISDDGSDHSAMLLGPLVLVWLLLIRWPGQLAVLRHIVLRVAAFGLRVATAVIAIAWLVNWKPISAYYTFYFNDKDAAPLLFRLLSPAAWFGQSFLRFSRPEWYLFNAGLWLAIIGVAIFIWWAAWRASPFLGWPRFYVAFVASRLLQKKRIAFFSVGAVTLCVAMMIIVISVMGGFADSIRAKAHGLLGDLVMDGGLQGFPYYQEFIDHLKQLPMPTEADLRADPKEFPQVYARHLPTSAPQSPPPARLVEEATPLIHTFGILQFPANKKTAPVSIWGIRLNEYARVNEFGHDLYYENRFGRADLAKPTQQPVYGFEHDRAVLPPEMERHYREFLASLLPDKRAEEVDRFPRHPGEGYYGPGVFKIAEPPTTGPDDAAEVKPGFEGKPYPGVILGRDVIFQRKPSGEYSRGPEYPIGAQCRLTMLPVTRGGELSQEPPPTPSFRYVDDSRTGIHEIDSRNVYIDFDILQRLLSMSPVERAEGGGMAPARCKQIQIKLAGDLGSNRERLARIKALVVFEWEQWRNSRPLDPLEDRMMAQVDVLTWEEMQQGFISAVEKEKVLVVIMFGVISIVAVLLILCIFYMIVQEKVRDVGILKSVGASAEGVTSVFLAYGAAIGLVGCVLGSILGIQFVAHINDIQDWLARLNPEWRVWSPETYSFDKIPDMWKWSEVIAICIMSVLASVAGAAIPATRAGRSWPVESLRYE